MVAVLMLFGPALMVGAAVALATRRALGRTVIALLAGAAAAAAWIVFAFDWFVYSVSENGPSYYAFSDYVEYRRALEGVAAIAAGVGYAAMAGGLVAGAALLYRRAGPVPAACVAIVAAGSVVLPVAVPAALSRVEYGKDPVFHLARGGAYVDRMTGRPTVCFLYGVEGTDSGPPTGTSQPELCLAFRATAAARALVGGGGQTVYEIGNRLNESGVRPYDRVDDLDLGSLEIARSEWPNRPASGQAPKASVIDTAVGDERTRSNILRLAEYMGTCQMGAYLRCVDPYWLHAERLRIGAGAAELKVGAVDAHGFTIEATSREGRTFQLARRDTDVVRSCFPQGLGGCSRAGRW